MINSELTIAAQVAGLAQGVAVVFWVVVIAGWQARQISERLSTIERRSDAAQLYTETINDSARVRNINDLRP